jgi:hypothetical protein
VAPDHTPEALAASAAASISLRAPSPCLPQHVPHGPPPPRDSRSLRRSADPFVNWFAHRTGTEPLDSARSACTTTLIAFFFDTDEADPATHLHTQHDLGGHPSGLAGAGHHPTRAGARGRARRTARSARDRARHLPAGPWRGRPHAWTGTGSSRSTALGSAGGGGCVLRLLAGHDHVPRPMRTRVVSGAPSRRAPRGHHAMEAPHGQPSARDAGFACFDLHTARHNNFIRGSLLSTSDAHGLYTPAATDQRHLCHSFLSSTSTCHQCHLWHPFLSQHLLGPARAQLHVRDDVAHL